MEADQGGPCRKKAVSPFPDYMIAFDQKNIDSLRSCFSNPARELLSNDCGFVTSPLIENTKKWKQ
jgi:hypothetical protein